MNKMSFFFLLFIFSCHNPAESDSEIIDCLGIMGGNAVEDCAGICNGDAVEDDCGICNGGNASMDENGVCFVDDYEIGQVIHMEHQALEFAYCYPPEISGNTFSFASHANKVFMLEMSASW